MIMPYNRKYQHKEKIFDPDFFKDNTKKAMNIEGMFYLIA